MVLYKTTDDDDDDDDNNWTNGRTDWMSQAQAIYSSHSIIQAFIQWQLATSVVLFIVILIARPACNFHPPPPFKGVV